MQWESREPPLCLAVHSVLERDWKIGEQQKEDEEKPNLLANGIVRCFLSFLRYLHWQGFIRDLWPSVLQIYCICCGFRGFETALEPEEIPVLHISWHLTFLRIKSFMNLLTAPHKTLPGLMSHQWSVNSACNVISLSVICTCLF